MQSKRTLFFILYLFMFFSVSAYGQHPLLEKEIQLKPGIYKNLQELQQNAPSVKLDSKIKSKNFNQTFISHKTVQYFLKMKKRKCKETGYIFGFCDGRQVYITSAQPGPFSAKTPFYALELHGRYNFVARKEDGHPTLVPIPVAGGGMGMSPGSTNMVNFYIFDMNTAEFLSVTKNSIKKELSPYPELLNRYKEDKKRKGKTERYIKELINQKNLAMD